MKKKTVYYKVITESSGLRQYLKERSFNDLETAIEYAEKCWQEYKPHFLEPKERKIIHEYIKEDKILHGYHHQIVATWNDGFAEVLDFSVRKKYLFLYDNIDD